MAKDNWIKNVSFILAILILLVSVIQVGLSTFWPSPDYPDTYRDCYAPKAVDEPSTPDQECLDEQKALQDAYDKERQQNNNIKFVVGTVLSLLAILLVLFVTMDNNIVYGLFGGAVINQLFNLRFVENKNIVGFVALLILFILVIFFVQRKSKK